MDLLKREELLDYMCDIDKEIKEKTFEEQKQIIMHKVMDVLKYIQNKDTYDSYSQDRQKKFLSGRQIGTLMDSIKCLDNKEFLNAYFEMCDFVHDNGAQDSPDLSIGEIDLLVLQLNRIIA